MEIDGEIILLNGDPLREMLRRLAGQTGLSERMLMFAALDVYRVATRMALPADEAMRFDARSAPSRTTRRVRWRLSSDQMHA